MDECKGNSESQRAKEGPSSHSASRQTLDFDITIANTERSFPLYAPVYSHYSLEVVRACGFTCFFFHSRLCFFE